MIRSIQRRLVALVVVAAVISTAAACSGSGSEDAGETTKPGQSEEVTPTPPPRFTGKQHKLPRGDALRNDPDLYDEVALTACTKSAGRWHATGSASNPRGRRSGYRVLVYFTDPQARTLDWARARVTVAAGSSGTWRVARRLEADVQVRCVVRAVDNAARPRVSR